MKTLAIVLGTMTATVVIQRLAVLVQIMWEAYGHDVVAFLRGIADRCRRLHMGGRSIS